MDNGHGLKPVFNFHSQATLHKRFKTPESRSAAITTIDRAANLIERITAKLADELKQANPSTPTLDLEPRDRRAAAIQQANDAAHGRFKSRAAVIIKARDNLLQKIERKQFMPTRRHATAEQEERFKNWARDKRTELRQQQANEKSGLRQVQQIARDRVAARAANEHEPKKAALKRQLDAIKARRDNTTGLKAVMYKVSGMQEKDQEKSNDLVRDISKIDHKITTEKNSLRDLQDVQTKMIDTRHVDEAGQLEYGISRAADMSENFSIAASDHYLTLTDVFNLAAAPPNIGGGRSMSAERGPDFTP
jgi:hypothetical protein